LTRWSLLGRGREGGGVRFEWYGGLKKGVREVYDICKVFC